MDVDMVDIIEAAEDRIGALSIVLANLLDTLDHADIVFGAEVVDRARTEAQSVLDAGYERPGCDEDCDNEFCGSPRHVDQTWNDSTGEWEND